MSETSSILFESPDHTIVVVDIPRSLEEAQVAPSEKPRQRIFSAPPAVAPFATPEPKSSSSSSHDAQQQASPGAQLADLMTAATVQSALDDLRSLYPGGPFHLPRLVRPDAPLISASSSPLRPHKAEALHGSIQALREQFDASAPRFDLLVLDPPWPNRSARRKKTDHKYATVANLREMRSLLLDIPVASHLKPDGLVAVWITNKSSIHSFLTSPTGLFAVWGLEVVAEWTWLKVTVSGEPIFDVESKWRKPWERLVIAKRIGAPKPEALNSKVILAVPDLHSRKPNLRRLFQPVFGKDDYLGLEVFARNLTAGWWSWGDDVYHFQQPQNWAPIETEEARESV